MFQGVKSLRFIPVMILFIAFMGCAGVSESPNDVSVLIPFPHPEGWEQYLFHGNYSLELGKDSCAACHEDDFTGGISGISCYSCHGLYPHATDWALISGHGNYLKTTDFNKWVCATNCHGTDFTGGASQISCYSCHSLYPHSPDWAVTPDSQHPHADYVETNGDAACINCHVDIKAPFPLPNPQCQYCH